MSERAPGAGASRHAIPARFAAVSVVVVVVLVAAISAAAVLRQRDLFHRGLDEKGLLLASTLSQSFADALYFNDVERLRYLAEVLQTQPEITDFQVFNREGRVLVTSTASKYPEGSVPADVLRRVMAVSGPSLERRQDRVAVLAPITVGAEVLGGVSLELSAAAIAPQFRRIVAQHLVQGLLVVILGVGLSVALVRALRTREELRESEERLRHLAEGMREVLWMTDLRTGELLYISPAYEAIWGRSRQSAYADPGSRLAAVHPDDRERARRAAQGESTYPGTPAEYRVTTPDGAVRWIRERVSILSNSEGPYRLVGAAEDVTEQKRLEAELLHVQKMESLGQMAGGVSHDFNNLLTAILGFATLGQTRRPDREQAHYFFGQIRKAAERGAGLTQKLLSFSRRQVADPVVVSMNTLVRQFESLLRRVVAEDVELITSLAPDLANTKIDPGQFEQVLMNLVANASDAMPKGGRLRITTAEEVVGDAESGSPADARPGEYVVMRVSDTGGGISEEVRGRIFEPFFSTKERGSSTGLGLATCYGIVRQAGGFIAVDSEPGRGSTFGVYLPVVEASAEQLAAVVPESARADGTETVLVAEDEEDVRAVILDTLESHGYTVLTARDGAHAVEVADGFDGEIDLLISDVVMPGMRGSELARTLRAQRPLLRVLLISGYTEDTAETEAITSGDLAFLAKPFTPQRLAQRIRAVFEEEPQ